MDRGDPVELSMVRDVIVRTVAIVVLLVEGFGAGALPTPRAAKRPDPTRGRRPPPAGPERPFRTRRSGEGLAMAPNREPQSPIEVEHGDAVVPDADDAARARDLLPEDPPADAPVTGDPDKKPAVASPVPAHGEMASQEQLREAAIAAEASEAGATPEGTQAEGEDGR